MELSSSDIARITNGRLTGPGDLIITEIVTDSRQLSYSEGLAFCAIRGRNHDAHQYIGSLYEKGIRCFITDATGDNFSKYPGAAFIQTGNSISALQDLAAHIRQTFSSNVIAITGSAGKTIVKEWLADVIGLIMPVIRSPKSYNSQIGVPLSVLRLDNKYRLGIFEAGISMPGEMEKLREVIRPDIGVITNIGDAHSENFRSLKDKAAEKLKLFMDARQIVYCRDHEIINKLILSDRNLASKDLFDWSASDPEARVYVSAINSSDGKTTIKINFKGHNDTFTIPFTDRASVENAITVATVCFASGLDADVTGRGLASLTSVAMRMDMKSGINGCRIIEDYYNSDPGSLRMALEFLRSHKGKRTTLILSDFVQSGRDVRELYAEVSDLLKRTGINRFIGIGKELSANRDLFDSSFRFFSSTDEFIASFNHSDFRNEMILLKGARAYEFERIAGLMEEKIHQSILEINLDAFSHNLNEFRRCLKPGTRIMAMVKAFAYGAGPGEISSLLEYHRVSYLAVAYVDEGVELRNGGVTLPIMVMNPDPAALDMMINHSLEPEIYSFESFDTFIKTAARHGLVNYPIHLKIDSGMHRLGFLPGEIDRLAEIIKGNDTIKVISVFSHLAGSEDEKLDHFSHMQAAVFIKSAAKLREATGYPFMRHILNSAGIARFPEYQFEMVRPGIGMYGIGHFKGLDLKPTGRFKTRISQTKAVKAGEPVGYSCADVSDTDRTIAIVPVGYADGLRRNLGNRIGSMFVRGHRVPVIGNVCMDMCMLDITGVDAVTGDEAEIFGEHITIDEIAEKCCTIPYEILTSIPMRVKRVFYRE